MIRTPYDLVRYRRYRLSETFHECANMPQQRWSTIVEHAPLCRIGFSETTELRSHAQYLSILKTFMRTGNVYLLVQNALHNVYSQIRSGWYENAVDPDDRRTFIDTLEDVLYGDVTVAMSSLVTSGIQIATFSDSTFVLRHASELTYIVQQCAVDIFSEAERVMNGRRCTRGAMVTVDDNLLFNVVTRIDELIPIYLASGEKTAAPYMMMTDSPAPSYLAIN